MSKHRHDHGTPHSHGAATGKRRPPLALVGLLLGTAIAAAIFLLTPKSGRLPDPTPPTPPPSSPQPPAPAAGDKADAQKLVGRWLRPDGGYVLDIQKVKGDRTLEAAYLNPNPIKVARAEMEEDGKKVRVRVELRDAGYPGCIYKLTYDPEQDRMTGTYFQAALQETFDVEFTRMQ